VLEGLDEVPWERLSHAYGSAGDVPGLLRDLRASDLAVCEQALTDLFASITHQGTRYPATAPAVPFLAELAAASDTPNRHDLLLLLAYAAVGTDWPSLPDGVDPARFGDPSYAPGCGPGRRQDEVPWARAAYQAVSQEVPQLLGLVDDDDPRLRQASAYLVAWFPRHAAAGLGRLRARLGAEPDPNAAATMVVAVGLLAGAHGQVADAPLLAELLGAPEPLVRWAAAIALARLVDDPPEPAVAELLGWATGTTPSHPRQRSRSTVASWAAMPWPRPFGQGRPPSSGPSRPCLPACRWSVQRETLRDCCGTYWASPSTMTPSTCCCPDCGGSSSAGCSSGSCAWWPTPTASGSATPMTRGRKMILPPHGIRSGPTGCPTPERNSKPMYSCKALVLRQDSNLQHAV
jgi:hypothetical protein